MHPIVYASLRLHNPKKLVGIRSWPKHSVSESRKIYDRAGNAYAFLFGFSVFMRFPDGHFEFAGKAECREGYKFRSWRCLETGQRPKA